jgi:hypothetical protein
MGTFFLLDFGGKEKKITNFPKIEEGKNKKYIELPVPYRRRVKASLTLERLPFIIIHSNIIIV